MAITYVGSTYIESAGSGIYTTPGFSNPIPAGALIIIYCWCTDDDSLGLPPYDSAGNTYIPLFVYPKNFPTPVDSTGNGSNIQIYLCSSALPASAGMTVTYNEPNTPTYIGIYCSCYSGLTNATVDTIAYDNGAQTGATVTSQSFTVSGTAYVVSTTAATNIISIYYDGATYYASSGNAFA